LHVVCPKLVRWKVSGKTEQWGGGKYRIIYKIDKTKKEIVFYDVDLKKRVYR